MVYNGNCGHKNTKLACYIKDNVTNYELQWHGETKLITCHMKSCKNKLQNYHLHVRMEGRQQHMLQ